MNQDNTTIFNNDFKMNIGEEKLVLAQPTELIEEAKSIAQNTIFDEKFPFELQYDANQKDFLLSILGTVGAVIESDDEKEHLFSTMMNMAQLAFVKRLECVERVKTDEGINPFLAEETVKLTTIQHEQQDSEKLDGVTPKIITDVDNEPVEVQTEFVSYHTTDANVESVAMKTSDQENNGVEVVAVAASSRSSCSCCTCPTNTTMETARTISEEGETSGYICCPGTEQWFKFVATKTGQYTILATGGLDTIGTLYDCYGKMIVEEDDYEPYGKINFRIIRNLTAGNMYYVRVRLYDNNTGNYTLKVTHKVLVNEVVISKGTINLKKGITYELPVTPNYVYKAYNNAERIPELFVSIDPPNADEQRVSWRGHDGHVLNCSYGWDDDGEKYIHVTAKEIGTSTLIAEDLNGNGKQHSCKVNVKYWKEHDEPTIYSRTVWGARSKITDRLETRERNPERIIFHHTARPFDSESISAVKAEIRRVQDIHMDTELKCDIAYHFIIDPVGRIWQGAEIDNYKRGHAEGYFDDIGVVLLGNFEPEFENLWCPNILNNYQKNAMKELSKWLCFKYNLNPVTFDGISPITTHRMVSESTVCPGTNLATWIENDLKNYIGNWYLT